MEPVRFDADGISLEGEFGFVRTLSGRRHLRLVLRRERRPAQALTDPASALALPSCRSRRRNFVTRVLSLAGGGPAMPPS
jgi:hypothetical protein